MEGEGVVVGGRVFVVVAGDGFDDEGDEAGEDGGDEDCADGPDEDLAADDDATQIHVLLLLLLLRGTQQPALLRLVQRPRQRRPVQLLQVPAPILVGGRVSGVYLQWATPRIPTVHTHLLFFLLL